MLDGNVDCFYIFRPTLVINLVKDKKPGIPITKMSQTEVCLAHCKKIILGYLAKNRIQFQFSF